MDRGYQDSSTWNAFQAEFDTARPPPPRDSNARFVGTSGRKNKGGDEEEAQTAKWNRAIFAYRSARWFATRQTIVREAFLSGGARREEGGVVYEREYRQGWEEAVEKNRKVGRVFDSLLLDHGYEQMWALIGFPRVAPVDNSIKLVFFLLLLLLFYYSRIWVRSLEWSYAFDSRVKRIDALWLSFGIKIRGSFNIVWNIFWKVYEGCVRIFHF